MDFYRICTKEVKGEPLPVLYPDFVVGRSKDIMIRGKSFYAIWDEEAGLWTKDEFAVQRIIDNHLIKYADESGAEFNIKFLSSFGSRVWSNFRQYMQNLSDNSHELDQHLTFANTEVKKSDYVSKRLPYALAPGDHSAWDEIVGTLYSVEERAKIEWAIGAVVSGDAKKIQKFMVFYGPAGTGKSTILNIILKLFEGYTTTFNAKDLGSSNKDFATEAFAGNPLVAVQQDGDLSKIEDNTRLNSIVGHDVMRMNEKFKPGYDARILAFLFMGTNMPVKISDAKSGIIRRLIDVHPTGVTLEENHYNTLMSQIDFELGAIAHHCLAVYRSMGRNFYSGYRPLEMMLQTDVYFNYIEWYYDVFKKQDCTTLKQAYLFYKEFCAETGIDKVLPQYKFREELRNYFDDFKERTNIDGHEVRSYYSGFKADRFKSRTKQSAAFSLVVEETESLFDELAAEWPAQYEIFDEKQQKYRPEHIWANVKTKLSELDTAEIHFVKVPESHIIIDFDLKDENGEKSLEKNLEAASSWPSTYAELSKSGHGVHLHYEFEGDVTTLSPVYSDGIEIKTLLGNSSLRRRLTKCNNIPVASIAGGLPLKEKNLKDVGTIKSEMGLRSLIARNLRKEIHPSTVSSCSFIKKILDEAYESGMSYDLTDMKAPVMAFALNSTNQSHNCIELVQSMKFVGDEYAEASNPEDVAVKDERPVHYDVEVFPNLFVICWKYDGDADMVKMINPSAQEVSAIVSYKLIGFNNRRYDNHILYGAMLGYDNQQLYELSQAIVVLNDRKRMFGEAYNLSYADIYDFANTKMSLKMWQIKLGIKHQESSIPWDEPVPEELWDSVVDYCCNDVLTQEAVFNHLKADFKARQILAELSGLTVNDTTAKHAARIIFNGDRNPQASFKYTHLKELFPGYTFEGGKSHYRDELVGEGGYVYAEPGMYENVTLLDVASMHPASIEQLDLFGQYTPNFSALKAVRMAIKHGDYTSAREMYGGKLNSYFADEGDAKALSYALKIVINSVYGLTSAKFDNPFRDLRNRDNIVAKRGALFMIDLKHYVQEMGLQVIHIKTDSIKIPNLPGVALDRIMNFAAKYGYEFEVEAVYEKLCLVNEAVYIAREDGQWSPTGAQFLHPYVFKTLFSGETVTFDDLCETKQVQQGAMYLDFEHDTPMVTAKEGLRFVGRTGRFVPVKEGLNGAMLYRVKDDKHYSVAGTKGYLWLEADMVTNMDDINMEYFEALRADAIKTIEKFGSFEELIS